MLKWAFIVRDWEHVCPLFLWTPFFDCTSPEIVPMHRQCRYRTKCISFIHLYRHWIIYCTIFTRIRTPISYTLKSENVFRISLHRELCLYQWQNRCHKHWIAAVVYRREKGCGMTNASPFRSDYSHHFLLPLSSDHSLKIGSNCIYLWVNSLDVRLEIAFLRKGSWTKSTSMRLLPCVLDHVCGQRPLLVKSFTTQVTFEGSFTWGGKKQKTKQVTISQFSILPLL